jgi:hypothetical protein
VQNLSVRIIPTDILSLVFFRSICICYLKYEGHFFNWTTVFKWCDDRFGSKKDTIKIMCLKDIGVRAQYLLTILGPIINIIGDLHDHIVSSRIFTLIMNKIFI